MRIKEFNNRKLNFSAAAVSETAITTVSQLRKEEENQ